MASEAVFYMVYIDRLEDVTLKAVTEQMDKCVDWYRLSEETWIVYSTVTPEKLYARFSPLAKTSGRLFVCKLDTKQRQGWMDKSFWSWLKREDGKPEARS